MGQLAGIVVCISGHPNLDKDDNRHIREQFTDENVSKWLKHRGGQLVEEVTKATTHLICSRAAYRKKGNPKVKAARKYGCEIVTYEWLTDTLQLLDYQNRKAPPSLYHPGNPRDGDAIAENFRQSEKKVKAAKKKTAPAETDSTAAERDDNAGAADETAETGMKRLTISEEKLPPKISEEEEPPKASGDEELSTSSEADEGNGTEVTDDARVGKKSGESTKEREESARSKDQEPPVDLSLYSICKDESVLHQIEVCKPDEHGNAQGCRLIMELYESKSEPRTYLFGARKYPTPGSSTCIRRFSPEAHGDKEPVFERYKAFFRKITGVEWHQRDLMPSTGPFYYSSPAVTGKKIGSPSHENKPNEVEGEKTQNAMADARRHHKLETPKRKGTFSEEERPEKALKVTKPSVVGDLIKATDSGSKTA